MAMLAAASRSSLRIILLSSCVLSSALLLHYCLPAITGFVTYELPSTVATWLRPPYVYILINCIILSIVVSSKLQHGTGSDDGYAGQSPVLPEKAVPIKVSLKEVGVSLPHAEYKSGYVFGGVEDLVVDDSVVVVTAQEKKKMAPVEGASAQDADFADVEVSDPTLEHKRGDSTTQFTVTRNLKVKEYHPEIVKQPFLARFNPPRATKSNLEGKALRVSRTSQKETLESTWRRIADGRATPPTRCPKKSDTWRGTHSWRGCNDENTRRNKELFGETSLGQDEFNRRVEEFIRKFNEEMRLER